MTRRCGKGKGFRKGSIRRLQAEALAFVKERHIAENISLGCNLRAPHIEHIGANNKPMNQGYRLSANGMNIAKRFRMPFGGGSISKGERSELPDSQFYRDKLDVHGGAKAQSMVRVGTTPPRKLLIDDEDNPGKRKMIRLTAKPRYGVVGMQGSIPKDGGK